MSFDQGKGPVRPQDTIDPELDGFPVTRDYRGERRLGLGAGAIVFEAIEIASGERVALKVPRRQDEASRARVRREAAALGRVSHPAILRLRALVDDGEACFLALDLVEGTPLLDATRARRLPALSPLASSVPGDADRFLPPCPADLPRLCRALRQLAEGLGALHAAGVVHRGLRSASLLVGPDGRLRVTRFRTAIVTGGRPSVDEGAALVLAPEGEVFSPASDWYAVGVLLHEALTGRPRVSGDLAAEGPAPALEALVSGVPPALEALCAALLADDPAQRPAAAGVLAALAEAPAEASPGAQDAAGAPPPRSEDERPPESEPPPPDPLLDQVLAGKYLLTSKLGAGGMGAVYRARTGSGEPLAVKIIRADRAGAGVDATRRFVREARVAMAIRSEHVARVREVDTDARLGVPYIAMDLLVGHDLAAQIEQKGALDPTVVSALFAQACEGLAAAHEAGVVHRDIKPANLFLHEQDGALVVKVCDFGIAKKTLDFTGAESTAADLTLTGGMLGSPFYMSPEQARNAKGVDARSDLWSLCMSLYEALAGRRPWLGQMSLGELIFHITTQEVPPLAGVAPWVPEGLCAVVHRGLRRDPKQRWSSARELREALRPFAAGAPRPESLVPVPEAERESASQRRLQPAARAGATPASVPPPRGQKMPRWAIGGLVVVGLLVALVAGGLSLLGGSAAAVTSTRAPHESATAPAASAAP